MSSLTFLRLIVLLILPLNIIYGDIYRIFGVSSDDTLSVRSGPRVKNKKIYALPYDAKNLTVSLCRKISRQSTWCKISYYDKEKKRSIYGWVNAKFLFPVTPDPILEKKETMEKAKKLIYEIIKAIVYNRPCDLNRYINNKFGLYLFIIPSGMHVRVHHMNHICMLDSEKYTKGAYGLVGPVMGDWNVTMPDKLLFGKMPIYDYGVDFDEIFANWRMKNGSKPKRGFVYIDTLENDEATEGIFFDPNITDRYIPWSHVSRDDKILLRRLKYMQRFSYRVVWPEDNLAFYITLIDGKFYLTAIDFASMNII